MENELNKCDFFLTFSLKNFFPSPSDKKNNLPTDRPYFKTVSRVTSDKLFFKDGLMKKIV